MRKFNKKMKQSATIARPSRNWQKKITRNRKRLFHQTTIMEPLESKKKIKSTKKKMNKTSIPSNTSQTQIRSPKIECL